ncbi:MAG: TolC family protein, partial [Candidatus Eisenbacteria bacterium]
EERLVEDALAVQPALQSAEASLRRSEVSWKLARNASLPQVDLTATFTRAFDSGPDVGPDLYSTRWQAAVQLSLPMTNRELKAEADIARFSYDQERDRLTLLRLETQRSVREALRTLKGIAEELQAIRQTIVLAEEKVDFASAMFNLGRASNLDLTDAREALVKGRGDFVRKLADYHGQLAVLQSLTGRELMP